MDSSINDCKNEIIAIIAASLSSPPTDIIATAASDVNINFSMKKSPIPTFVEKEAIDDFAAYNNMKHRVYQSASTRKRKIKTRKRNTNQPNLKRRSLNLVDEDRGNNFFSPSKCSSKQPPTLIKDSDDIFFDTNNHDNGEDNMDTPFNISKSSNKYNIACHDDNEDNEHYSDVTSLFLKSRAKKLKEFVSLSN
jgi:hypothetical protein